MADDIIVSTRDHPGDYDAIASAKPGEIIFTIQSGDVIGPATVDYWAMLERERGLNEPDSEKREAILRKASHAEQVAWRMREQQAGHVELEPVRARYSEDAAAPEVSDERAARIRAAALIGGIEADIVDVLEQLSSAGHEGEGVDALRIAFRRLKDARSLIEPREGRERT